MDAIVNVNLNQAGYVSKITTKSQNVYLAVTQKCI